MSLCVAFTDSLMRWLGRLLVSKATYPPAAVEVGVYWHFLLLLVDDAARFDWLIALLLRGEHEGLPVLVERV